MYFVQLNQRYNRLLYLRNPLSEVREGSPKKKFTDLRLKYNTNNINKY